MEIPEGLIFTPWDSVTFDMPTYEIVGNLTNDVKSMIQSGQPGHYTVKVDPLSSKESLHNLNFYYCDTLIEPFCKRENFIFHHRDDIYVSESESFGDFLAICRGAFRHGRFHRDFKLQHHLSDRRYDSWLKQLYDQKQVFGLKTNSQLAGFWAYSENKILLHALHQVFRGKGLAKFFWSAACDKLFSQGYGELQSSISASNMPILNLYVSLGFKFRNPQDIYHLMITANSI